MKQKIRLSIVLTLLLTGSAGNLLASGPAYSLTEISTFQEQSNKHGKILEMGYASYQIKNPEVWTNLKKNKRVYKVDIVFTKYPLYKKDWITHYDTLLEKRIQAVCQLEPTIVRSAVTWNLVLQTDCQTEEEAKTLFHGVVIWYKELPETKPDFDRKPASVAVLRQEEFIESKDVEELMSGQYEFRDSVVFKVFERNPQWRDMLIVGDWTSSMYAYGAQAVLWHRLSLEKKRVSQFVFFNDGDERKHKPIGKTGGIYFANPNNIEHVIHLMKKVQRKGDGGDMPENDIEALIKATEKTKAYKEVILIADNKSAVKDMKLLKELKVPVRVIVCGAKKGETIRHDYLQIASATKGSVHTIEEDIWDLSELKEGEKTTIMNVPYQRTRGRIIKSNFKMYHDLKAHL